MPNNRATIIARKSGKPKQSIPRFKVLEPKAQAKVIANKIVIFGLPLDATVTDIKDAFRSYGVVDDIYIPQTKEGYDTKYAFVTFRESNAATRIITDRQAIFVRDFPLSIRLYRNKE